MNFLPYVAMIAVFYFLMIRPQQQRAKKESTVALWKKIKTFEDKEWTKKYHDKDPKKKCFGGRIVIKMKDGTKIEDELEIADANPFGKRPFERKNYLEKFS